MSPSVISMGVLSPWERRISGSSRPPPREMTSSEVHEIVGERGEKRDGRVRLVMSSLPLTCT